jgi:hypothetical protein
VPSGSRKRIRLYVLRQNCRPQFDNSVQIACLNTCQVGDVSKFWLRYVSQTLGSANERDIRFVIATELSVCMSQSAIPTAENVSVPMRNVHELELLQFAFEQNFGSSLGTFYLLHMLTFVIYV